MSASQQSFPAPIGDFELEIGTHPKGKLKIQLSAAQFPDIESRHAILKRVGDRVFLKYLARRVDSKLKQWLEINPGEGLPELVGQTRKYSLQIDPAVYQSRPRRSLETTVLTYEVSDKGKIKRLCDNVYLRAKPGTLTAIMGPSGCGKSTFLQMLRGNYQPTNNGGIFVINPEKQTGLNLHEDYDKIRDFFGYAPQGDSVFADLTTYQSLQYTLQLAAADKSLPTDKRILDTCGQLDLKGDDLLKKRLMGSAEMTGVLSGGQRRRATIAHTLITQPLLLILDEPTSGLSSVDSDNLIRQLKKLAVEQNLAVVATIHQPSRDAFKLFDDLFLMAKSGRLIYYGSTQGVVPYFEQRAAGICGNKNPAEYALDLVSLQKDADETQYERDMDRRVSDFAKARTTEADLRQPLTTGQTPQAETASSKNGLQFLNLMMDWLILIRRNFNILWANKKNPLMLFGQVPIIALCIGLAFSQFAQDERGFDEFARNTQSINILADFKLENKMPLNVSRIFGEARADAASKANTRALDGLPEWISQSTAQRRAAIYYLLIAASIWFGVMGSCKEVVGELAIIRREARAYLRPAAYLAAKMVVQIVNAGIQTGLLAALVGLFLLDLKPDNILILWLALAVTAWAAAALGLCVSCLTTSLSLALTLIPLLIIPQLIFGGLLRPEIDLPHDAFSSKVNRTANTLMLQRWGFAAALAADTYADGGVLKRTTAAWPDKERVLLDDLIQDKVIEFADMPLATTFFGHQDLMKPLLMLAFYWSLFLLIGYGGLKMNLRKE